MPPNSRPNRTMLRRALFLLAACGIAAFAVLMLQLFRLQILRHDELESAALQQQHLIIIPDVHQCAPPHGDPRLARDDL